MPPSTQHIPVVSILPASLSHFVIFNPSLRPPAGITPKTQQDETRDKDDEDDLREAAQILFYTSREAGGVSRDTMLRQVGLAKGLMGFSDMISKDDSTSWFIHGHKSRMILYMPEPDFFIYINITLAHLDNEKKDPVAQSQGLSNELIVDALAKGFEDFRLLHGPLHTLLPPSRSLSTILDKFFTRFAFQFESDYLTSPPPLSSWVDGYPAPSLLDQQVITIREELDETSRLLVVGKDGPMYLDGDIADPGLLRFLVNLVHASLPPVSTPSDNVVVLQSERRQTLGFGLAGLGLGRRNEGTRKPSWATLGGWVPDIRRTSTPVPEASENKTQPSASGELVGTKEKPKWGFGLGGLGDAVGSMGTALGLGGSGTKTSSQTSPEPADDTKPENEQHSNAQEFIASSSTASAQTDLSADQRLPGTSTSIAGIQPIEETPLSPSELEDAVEVDEELEWDSKIVWMRVDKGDEMFGKRKLCWIIRNNILLAVVLEVTATEPYRLPTNETTTDLFSRLSTATPLKPISPGQNSYIAQSRTGVIEKQGDRDQSTDQALVEMKTGLEADPSIIEIYAKMSSSKVVYGKKDNDTELYLEVGKQDASLTDAEHAVRRFAGLHPEFAS